MLLGDSRDFQRHSAYGSQNVSWRHRAILRRAWRVVWAAAALGVLVAVSGPVLLSTASTVVFGAALVLLALIGAAALLLVQANLAGRGDIDS